MTAAQLRAEYTARIALFETSVAWSGVAAPTSVGSYVRIDGPRLWLEVIVRPRDVMPGALQHRSVWRDKSFDYIRPNPWAYLR